MIDDLIGLPYKLHGRGPDSYDCYGLVIEAEKREGKQIPDLFKEYVKTHASIRDLIKSAGLLKKTVPEEKDILLFLDSNGHTVHMGMYLKNDDFIHCDKYGVRITKLSSYFRTYEVFGWQD